MFKPNKLTLKQKNDQMNIIGRNIRLLRQKNGWSQGEVAKRLQISIPAFSKIETGITDINISRLDQIARLFEVSTLEIMVREDDISALGNLTEITALKDKLNDREEEIIKLQKRVIELYEELRRR